MTYYLLANRYQVGDVVGRGGMSEVHRGRDRRLSREVAVKMLRADLARNPACQERFRREARNAAALNHPNIVAVYDTGDNATDSGPVPYIVMEFVDGNVLRDVLATDGQPPPPQALHIAAEICVALDFSHRNGVVHRDIKPGNVMLGRAGAVKVMDFGTARAAAGGQGVTTATAIIGSARYLAPEQISGGRVDARTDVYATGCVLYELLVGRPPFTAPSAVAVAAQHVREAPRPPSEVHSGIPRQVDAIVLKALSKNPVNRYQTAAEMRTDLLRAMSGDAVQATRMVTGHDRADLDRAPQLTRAAAGVRVGAAGPAAHARPGRPVGAGSGPVHGAPLLAPVQTLPPPEPGDPTGAHPTRRFWRLAGIAALCVSVIVALTLTLLVVTAPLPPANVAVPDVTGMTLAEAAATLQDKHLTLGTITQVDSPKSTPKRVVNQRPSEKTEVAPDTAVNVEVDTS